MMFNKIALILLIMPTALKLMAMMSDDTAYARHGPLWLVTSNGKKRQLLPDELKSLESAMLHGAVSFRLTQAAELGVDPHALKDDLTVNPYLTARALKIVRKLARDKTRTDEVLAKRKVDVLAELVFAADNLGIDWLKRAAYGAFAQKMIKTSDKTFGEFAWVLDRVIARSCEEELVRDQLPLLPIIEQNHKSRSAHFAWSPNNKHLAIWDYTVIELWNARGDELERTIPTAALLGAERWVPIVACRWTPNANYLLVFTHTAMHAINTITGALAFTIPDCYCVAWSPNDTHVLVYGDQTYLYDLSTMHLLHVLECRAHPSIWYMDKWGKNDPTWSPDGNLVALNHVEFSHDERMPREIQVWNLAGKKLYTLPGRCKPRWSAHSKQLFTYDDKTGCWEGHDAGTGLTLYSYCTSGAVKEFFSSNNEYMLTYDSCNLYDIVEVGTGKVKHHLAFCHKYISPLAFSPDDTMLAVYYCDHDKNGTVAIVDVLTGIVKAFFGFNSVDMFGFGGNASWSADSQYLAVYSGAQMGVWRNSVTQYHIVPEVMGIHHMEWLLDNRHLMLVAESVFPATEEYGHPFKAYFYDCVTNKAKELKYEFRSYCGGMALSPDCTRLAIEADDQMSSCSPIYICSNQFMFNLPKLIEELRLHEHKK